MQTIKNDLFEVSVKERGGELCSFKSLKSGKEYIWQADPNVWLAHAPNLFPIVGCLKKNSFVYKGKEYKILQHGFFRKNDKVKLKGQTDNSLTYGLKYDDETLKIYPFMFELNIDFILNGNTLEVRHRVTNHGDGEMLFSLGGHPGFTCPLNDDEIYGDYYLEFEKNETAPTWQIDKDGLITKDPMPFFKNTNIINLHPHIFDNDALVFKNLNSKKVSLKSKKSNQTVTVSFDDFPNLGIWAKPNAQYVCIEPWLGIADSVDSNRNLEHKEGILRLQAKGAFTASYFISVEEP